MDDNIQSISWWSRIKDSIKGILVGAILIGISIFLLFWNEHHSIKTKLSLIEVSKLVVKTTIKPLNPNSDEKVVYVTGLASTKDKLYDSLLDINVNAISLHRDVKMYQWKETQHTDSQSNLGGSKTQTSHYNYHKEWSDKLIDSQKFKYPSNHTNPKDMRVPPEVHYAQKVDLGDFQLPKELFTQIYNSQPILLGDTELIKVKKELREPATIYQDQIYLGKNPQIPEIGDIKISLSAVYPQQVSIIAVQIGSTFEPYIAKAGQAVMLLESGNIAPEKMVDNALEKNKILTYWLRLLSWFFMIIGFALIFKPFVVLADVIPILGTFLSYGTGLMSLILGSALWISLFAIAWFAVRPYMTLGIFSGVVLVMYYLYSSRNKEIKEEKQKQ